MGVVIVMEARLVVKIILRFVGFIAAGLRQRHAAKGGVERSSKQQDKIRFIFKCFFLLFLLTR